MTCKSYGTRPLRDKKKGGTPSVCKQSGYILQLRTCKEEVISIEDLSEEMRLKSTEVHP